MSHRRTYSGLSYRWFTPYGSPPEDTETLDGRTLWAATVLDEVARDEILNHAPPTKPGDGWSLNWSPVDPNPPRRWSTEAKGRNRVRRLTTRLEKKWPLFADQFKAQELAERPAYFAGQ